MLDSNAGLRVEIVHTQRRTVYWQDDRFELAGPFFYAIDRAKGKGLIANNHLGDNYRSFYDEMEREDHDLGPMEYVEKSVGPVYRDRYDAFRSCISASVRDLGAHDVHGWEPPAEDATSVDLQLAKIRLVDPTNVSWETIGELKGPGSSYFADYLES